MKYDLIIIGAGAAGLSAAAHITPETKVLLLEKMNSAGRKLAVTGGGRCNYTSTLPNDEQLKHIRNGFFLKHSFKVFPPQAVVKWFGGLGVESAVEEETKLFATNISARQIADRMLQQALQQGCEFRQAAVTSLKISAGNICGVVLENGEEIDCRAVLLATGGSSYPGTGSAGDGYRLAEAAGHQIVQPLPALTPLETGGIATAEISGVVLDNVNISLIINQKKTAETSGILLFTHTGISGPAALSISGRAVRALAGQQKVSLEVDFYPKWSPDKADFDFQQLLNLNGKKNISNILSQLLPASLADLLLKTAGISAGKKGAEINGENRKLLLKFIKRCPLDINGYKGWKEAMVTAGGVEIAEISPKTLESKLVRGLYFAGEVIDIDGDTGGFNLQAAFATGVTAVQAVCKQLL